MKRYGTIIIRTLKKSVSPTLGTGGSLGGAETVAPDLARIVPIGIVVSVGGSLASGESISVRITANYDDGSSSYIDLSYSATGDYEVPETDLQSLIDNDKAITSLNIQAGSSESSTSATVTVTIRGIQY